MFDISGGILLPNSSLAERNVPAASKGHCTAHTVLGEGEGTRTQAESWLELCHLMLLNADEEVAELAEQQRFFFGEDEDDLQQHVFDVVATLLDGYRIAYTIKPEIRLHSGVFLEDMAEVSWWVRKYEYADDVQLLTDADIDQTDLRNAQMLASVREADPEADAAATRAIEALPDGACRSLRDLTIDTGMKARGYSALIRLLRRGFAVQVERGLIRPTTTIKRSYSLRPTIYRSA
ncbi:MULTISPECIES: hypothetical protein [unclassified Sulfitobacter]|uniref:hypothetical protein n=1 Tax=unclassified Sulfitobacter TaxID=196795 RepID=UPI0007C3E612|nr:MULTISPECIES: hypothetical protein [unclassified Sulfitobacter]KZX91956.1 hypothetical protein A3720_07920 [Sulfitobacter sp. HI0021]KZY00756.1 hypothetical protein A3722_09975 [Sulfitobacter sp. HI0027]KZZ01715.1 hypothetical protein A3747_03235 [Sulfitobacter sp. HI0076]